MNPFESLGGLHSTITTATPAGLWSKIDALQMHGLFLTAPNFDLKKLQGQVRTSRTAIKQPCIHDKNSVVVRPSPGGIRAAETSHTTHLAAKEGISGIQP